MSLTDVTHEAVLSAIEEHDEIGQSSFLERYGFGPARVYELVHNGRRYDSKAILGVAHRYALGSPLRSQDFSGGDQTVVRQLQRLGFQVERRGDSPPASVARPAVAIELQRDLQRVLDLADEYSKDSTPEMRARDDATRSLADALGSALDPMAGVLGIEALDLRVQPGGRQSNYSPVPWVRLYSKLYSPTAMEGFYLVYLFSADGARVYLSLNQGTSEFRSGAMRPINDRSVLLSRAAEARSRLAGLAETVAGDRGRVSLDLAWEPLQVVGRESKQRIRNYEDGNILAYEYVTGRIPPDEQLLEDLADMLPLLARLYRTPTVPTVVPDRPVQDEDTPAARIARKAVARRQGRQLDPVARKAIEVYAEDLAVKYFEGLGWTVERVSALNRGYDLDCRHPDEGALHVEAKGTQTIGEEVVLTPNEVRHNQQTEGCDAGHALYVVSEIQLDRADGVQCSEGRERCVWPWSIETESLTPTQYAYRVPPVFTSSSGAPDTTTSLITAAELGR